MTIDYVRWLVATVRLFSGIFHVCFICFLKNDYLVLRFDMELREIVNYCGI